MDRWMELHLTDHPHRSGWMARKDPLQCPHVRRSGRQTQGTIQTTTIHNFLARHWQVTRVGSQSQKEQMRNLALSWGSSRSVFQMLSIPVRTDVKRQLLGKNFTHQMKYTRINLADYSCMTVLAGPQVAAARNAIRRLVMTLPFA